MDKKGRAQYYREKYGDDYFSRIGRKGGKKGWTGGFAAELPGKDGLTGRERAKKAGRKGGKKSRRGKTRRRGYWV